MNQQFLLPIGKKIQINYPKKFRKSIQLVNSVSQNNEFSFQELVHFLINIPNLIFIVSTRSKNHNSIPSNCNFNIFCQICELKLFKISINLQKTNATIHSLSVCVHCKIEHHTPDLASFSFLSNLDYEKLTRDSFHSKHPFKLICQYIYKSNKCDNILKSFLHNLVFSQKSIYLHNIISTNSYN